MFSDTLYVKSSFDSLTTRLDSKANDNQRQQHYHLSEECCISYKTSKSTLHNSLSQQRECSDTVLIKHDTCWHSVSEHISAGSGSAVRLGSTTGPTVSLHPHPAHRLQLWKQHTPRCHSHSNCCHKLHNVKVTLTLLQISHFAIVHLASFTHSKQKQIINTYKI